MHHFCRKCSGSSRKPCHLPSDQLHRCLGEHELLLPSSHCQKQLLHLITKVNVVCKELGQNYAYNYKACLIKGMSGMCMNDFHTKHSTYNTWAINGSTPADVVLLRNSEVTLIELTIPHNSMESVISNARTRKSKKQLYQQALSDLEVKGFTSDLCTIEIGSLGHWLSTSQRAILQAIPSLSRQTIKKILDIAAHKTIGASHVIFIAQSDKTWMTPLPYFKV